MPSKSHDRRGVADAALLPINDVVLMIPPQTGQLCGERAVSIAPVLAKFGGFHLAPFCSKPILTITKLLPSERLLEQLSLTNN